MSEWQKVSTVAERLQEAMRICHKRQTDLAEETGIAKGTISNYINGRYEPKAPAIAKLAKALRCSEMWLIGFDVPMDRYAYVEPSDAEFLDALPPLAPKEALSPEIEAINVLLYSHGRCISKFRGAYFYSEGWELSENELNDLWNAVVIAAKNAADLMEAKRTMEIRKILSRKND